MKLNGFKLHKLGIDFFKGMLKLWFKLKFSGCDFE